MNKIQTYRLNISFIISLLLVVLFALSSHPTIVEISKAAGFEQGTILSKYINLLFAGLLVLSFSWDAFKRSVFIRIMTVLVAIAALSGLMTYTFFLSTKMVSEIRALIICLGSVIIGWNLKADWKRLKILMIVFSLSVVYVSLMQVYMNVGGFVINTLIYTDNKNELGVMISSVMVITTIAAFRQKGLRSYALLACSVALLVVLLTIRARTATLYSFALLAFLTLKYYNHDRLMLLLMLSPFILVLLYAVMPASVQGYIYDSFFMGNEYDITSGRMDRNAAAIDFLSSNMLLGNLNGTAPAFGWIHNYPLLQMFNYGMVFSLPILVLYFGLFFYLIVKSLRHYTNGWDSVGVFVLLVPFIGSLTEPTFPFGPGTTTSFNFLLYGAMLYYLSNTAPAIRQADSSSQISKQ